MDVNYKKAFEWYEKATEQGNAMAQSNMGVMYDFGLSVDENHKKTVEWYEMAAEQGTQMLNLSGMYYNGHSVDQIDSMVIRWHAKAAARTMRERKQVEEFCDGQRQIAKKI